MARPSVENRLIRYRMPAEWEPHAATWLAWPHYKLDWPGKCEPIPWVFAEIIRYLSRDERVELIVKDASAEKLARKTLRLAHALNENVRFHLWATDRIWTRDSGCAFVFKNQSARAGTPVPPPLSTRGGTGVSARAAQLAGVKWQFNAWAKYPNWKRDDKIGSLMAKAAGASEIQAVFGKKRI